MCENYQITKSHVRFVTEQANLILVSFNFALKAAYAVPLKILVARVLPLLF